MKTTLYWVTTGLLALVLLYGAGVELTRQSSIMNVLAYLGYPTYLATILGVWKILGAIALLVPGWPRIKEWAYAGVFFNMTGAAMSHLATADAAWHMFVTVAFAGLTLASCALRPASRRLGDVGYADRSRPRSLSGFATT